MGIDVGIAGAMNSRWGGGNTLVAKSNPANNTGLITSCTLWANGTCENVEIAAFTADGNSMTTRGYASLPNLASGANLFNAADGDFTPLEIRAGDYIGAYCTASMGLGIDGQINEDGIWRSLGDQIPCSGRTFDVVVPNTPSASIYATGYELGLINIGDFWKVIQNIQINVGDVWKQITVGSKVNIGDAWKGIFH